MVRLEMGEREGRREREVPGNSEKVLSGWSRLCKIKQWAVNKGCCGGCEGAF